MYVGEQTSLIIVLTNQQSIKEVIAFPAMKPVEHGKLAAEVANIEGRPSQSVRELQS